MNTTIPLLVVMFAVTAFGAAHAEQTGEQEIIEWWDNIIEHLGDQTSATYTESDWAGTGIYVTVENESPDTYGISLHGIAENGGVSAAAAKDGPTETIYSPSIMNSLNNVLTTPVTRTYSYDSGETIKIIPMVTGGDNTYQIRYDTYVNGTHISSYTVSIVMLGENLWHVSDDRHNVYITSDSTLDASRSVTLNSRLACIADPKIFGHGRASALAVNCHWQGSGTINIKPTNGKVSWYAPASINYWFQTYVFDEARINPHFATSSSFYTNIRSGSMSFDGIYSANQGYTARATLYYEN